MPTAKSVELVGAGESGDALADSISGINDCRFIDIRKARNS